MQEAVCDICGREEETEFHAVVSCGHAVNLRKAMQEIWPLPPEDMLNFSGPEWLLMLIDRADADIAARILLVLWRACYWDTLFTVRHNGLEDVKGKKQVGAAHMPEKESVCRPWRPPDIDWVKIGAYSESSGEAGIGVVIRDHQGQVVLTGWKFISSASSAEQVEALACREGLALAAEWASLRVILESDCVAVIKSLKYPQHQRSPSTFIIQEALEEASLETAPSCCFDAWP
ncbi:hypothetical protein C2845_PM18G01090 [Panicum miliaceum]|uniref:RNase H type-1 domain-containing protein n=1 Tax=Panicum miliaceum TaxID=4540 RepID=A0A3L6PJE9_PANMI|nr:hypothetical protein C2845_PM18G01090 [Panicum miliaceum]